MGKTANFDSGKKLQALDPRRVSFAFGTQQVCGGSIGKASRQLIGWPIFPREARLFLLALLVPSLARRRYGSRSVLGRPSVRLHSTNPRNGTSSELCAPLGPA